MSKEESHHQQHSSHHDKKPTPYIARAHKDWRVWIGAIAIAIALSIYVLTLDLSNRPAAATPVGAAR